MRERLAREFFILNHLAIIPSVTNHSTEGQSLSF